jgi:hypothetical protein
MTFMDTLFNQFPPLSLVELRTDEQGRLFHMATGHPLHLAPNVGMRLLLHPDYLLPTPPPFEPQTRKVLEPGENLSFFLNKTHWGKVEVTVHFPEGLYMFQNSAQDLPCCPEEVQCIVGKVSFNSKPYSPPDFEPIIASSLNQAYFQASKRYEPSRKSHSTDVYHTFKTGAGMLLREVWDQVGAPGKKKN